MTSRHLASCAATARRSSPAAAPTVPVGRGQHAGCLRSFFMSSLPSCLYFVLSKHTHTHQENLNKCGNRCPTSDRACPLLPAHLLGDRGAPLTKIRHPSPPLSSALRSTRVHTCTHTNTNTPTHTAKIYTKNCAFSNYAAAEAATLFSCARQKQFKDGEILIPFLFVSLSFVLRCQCPLST